MMKKAILAAIIGSSLTLLCPMSAFAQWDYGQSMEWNIIESRMERRRLEERLRARREAEKKSAKTAGSRRGKTKTSASAKRVAATKKVVAPVKSYGVWFHRDTFDGFPYEGGYRVNIDFISTTTGKKFPRFVFLGTWDDDEDIWDVPAGTYTLRAEAIQKGKKYPVHLAVIKGSREERPFETFTSSLKIRLKPIMTIDGKFVPDDDPLKLYVRVIQ